MMKRGLVIMSDYDTEKIKLSVIIPVYNVEKYLDRCINSLINQGVSSYEIILIDDESTDSSGEICDRWAEKCSHIRVVHKQNEGAGYARNTGIEIAKGEYLAYVDSDDYVGEGAFKKILKVMESTGADVCYFGNYDVLANGEKKQLAQIPKKLEYNGEETYDFAKDIIAAKPNSSAFMFGGVAPWSGVTRKEIVDKYELRFPSDREVINEDLFYNLKVALYSQKIVIIPERLYYYCHNDNNSITTSYYKDRFEAAQKMYAILLEELSQYVNNDADMYQRIERLFMSNLILCLKQEFVYNKKPRAAIRDICSESIVKKIVRNYPINKLPFKQKVFFYSVRCRNSLLIYLLLKLRNKQA